MGIVYLTACLVLASRLVAEAGEQRDEAVSIDAVPIEKLRL